MTRQNFKMRICGIFLLLLSMLIGCAGNQGEGNNTPEDSSKEETEIIQDTKVYILLNHNPDTKKLFLESVEEGLQEKFDYNEETTICDREGMGISIEELQPGELLQIVYTEEELLKEVEIAGDTFIYEGITDFYIDSSQNTITAAGAQYSYDENLKIFLEGELVPVSEIGVGNTICIRGSQEHIITLVANGTKETDTTEETGFWN